MNTRRRKRNL